MFIEGILALPELDRTLLEVLQRAGAKAPHLYLPTKLSQLTAAHGRLLPAEKAEGNGF